VQRGAVGGVRGGGKGIQRRRGGDLGRCHRADRVATDGGEGFLVGGDRGIVQAAEGVAVAGWSTRYHSTVLAVGNRTVTVCASPFKAVSTCSLAAAQFGPCRLDMTTPSSEQTEAHPASTPR
jgi:hypothetical protein